MSVAVDHIPVLEMTGITKAFPGVQALSNVDFRLMQGEVLALVGENGAGKSTLMKIIGGVHLPDTGSITVSGEETSIPSVQRATELGIAFVHQELNLSDNLDVAANVYLGREPVRYYGLRIVDRKQLYADTQQILDLIELDCSPRTPVRDLPIGSQQMVEIARAISIDAKILIMDEPTSSLSQKETVKLFEVIQGLKSRGVSVIYISHRLGEVKELADRVTVLRDGEISGHLSKDEIDSERMIRLMVGRDTEKFYHLAHEAGEDLAVEFRGIVTQRYPNKVVDLVVHRGEILVLAGLIGAGRTELAHAVFGIDELIAGTVVLDGEPIAIRDPQTAIGAGIGLVPEDRKLHGLILEMTVEQNITLPGLLQYQKARILLFKKIYEKAKEMVASMGIRATSIHQVAETLSGGNQQKVVLSKWLSLNPKVLILDEPTRGIDVVAKEEVYRLMENLANSGVTMLVISSEMQEVLGIADRIAVMHEGGIAGIIEPQDFSEEAVVTLATGGK